MFLIFWVAIILVVVFGTVIGMAVDSRSNCDKANALLKKAKYYTDLGDVDLAMTYFEEALVLDSENPEAYYVVGLYCVNYGKLDRAKELLCNLKSMDSKYAIDLHKEIYQN